MHAKLVNVHTMLRTETEIRIGVRNDALVDMIGRANGGNAGL